MTQQASSPATPPALAPHYRTNFDTLKRAGRLGDLALISALRQDGTPVALVVAIRRNDDGTLTPVPFAEMINGNPFELYQDPTV